MTWQDVLVRHDVDQAIESAIDRFIRDGCVHTHRDDTGAVTEDPAWCNCEENRVDPRELLDWIRNEVRLGRGTPVRVQPAGQPNRTRSSDPRLSLAVAV